MTLSLLLSAFAPAFGSNFTLHPGAVLTARDGTYFANGIGSPTVAYMPEGGRHGEGGYVMVFETRLEKSWMDRTFPSNDYSGCAQGTAWGLGIAVSEDGLDWRVVTGQPFVVPEPGSYYGCSAAHPSVIYDADAPGGPTLQVFFKAETAREGGGSNVQSGVGFAQARLTGNWTARSGWEVRLMSAPVLPLSTFGFPAVTRYGSTWSMWVAHVPSLYLATRSGDMPDLFTNPSATASFSLNPTPVMQPGATSWAPTRVYNPAVLCKDNAAYPYTMYVGGKGLDGFGGLLSGGWGEAISADGVSWFTGALPEVSWSTTEDWRHWDALLVQPGAGGLDPGPGTADYLVYYTVNVGGVNQVRFAYTASSWNEAETRSKVCTNSLMDAGFLARPLNPPGNPIEAPAEGGYNDSELAAAGCSLGGATGIGLAAMAPALLLARRRRR